ncbi:hypothetical protein CJ030_MR1G005401 [Morella rubra]|uniref:Uncharacterized protein n=1 Tax=Morella rubra TaxID=262757 RepID=A0A6A1WQM7_9ROSI|nr:hypothetical protein CJ030_MR1G005401 [Morella rubra]
MSRIVDTDSVPIERQDWIIDVSQVREPAQRPECCIYRVPKKLRKVNKDAYTPKLISIGPLHHRRKELRDMENLKVRYFKLYCNRALKGEEDGASIPKEKEVQLQKCIAKIVEDNSEKIRHCYAERPRLDHKEFVSMVLVDATFIIELFLRTFGDAEDLRNDYILSKSWLTEGIKQDLILLENQLPFFILEKIHEAFSMPVQRKQTDFLTLACGYLNIRAIDDQEKSTKELKEVKHLTDLLRYLLILSLKRNVACGGGDHPKIPKNTSNNPDKAGLNEASPSSNLRNSASKKPDEASQNADPSTFYNLPSASNLDGAGVEFQMVKGGLFDIEFKKSMCMEWIPCLTCSWLLTCLPCLKCTYLKSMEPCLEVPTFLVNNSTETIFRNLMALEQCHYPIEDTYICAYILLLDHLIDTEKDVDLLVRKKIILNHLGSNDAVATIINRLCEEIGDVSPYYSDLSEKLIKHYENFWNHAMATLKSAYFANIWTGTATVVGLIVLGFTLWGFIRPYVSHERGGGD